MFCEALTWDDNKRIAEMSKVFASTLLIFASVLTGWNVSTAQPAPEPKAADSKSLTVNQWVERPTSGWKGRDYYGNIVTYGFCDAGERGLMVLDLRKKAGMAHVRTLDLSTGA
jgi:hypothetical protein